MATAVVDTTVLYAAGNRSAQRHESALSIVRAADGGDIPRLHVPDPVLVETMNGLTRDVGHSTAVDMLERLEAGTRFVPAREPVAVWELGGAIFRSVERLSLADALIVACLRHRDLEYLYSFDAGFDGLDGVTRLVTDDDPFNSGMSD